MGPSTGPTGCPSLAGLRSYNVDMAKTIDFNMIPEYQPK